MQLCLQVLFSGHKRQRFTAGDEWLPADVATVSMNETFRASGHQTILSFS
jgi:hypothetical protein